MRNRVLALVAILVINLSANPLYQLRHLVSGERFTCLPKGIDFVIYDDRAQRSHDLDELAVKCYEEFSIDGSLRGRSLLFTNIQETG